MNDAIRHKSPLVWGIANGAKPPDRLPLSELATKHVHLHGSQYGTKYDLSVVPAHAFILDAFKDPAVKEIANIAPTGFGKTTIFEVCVSYAVAQDPGDTLMLGNNDRMIQRWMESRMLKTLRTSPWTKDFIPTGQYRNDAKKTEIIFKHMTFFTGGANKSNTQEASMRYCLGDEVWEWDSGMIGEFQRRHHNRLNRKMLLQSQGGNEETEWYNFCKNGKWHDMHHRCPECGEHNAVTVGMIRYGEINAETGKREAQKDANGEYDWLAINESIRLICPSCEAEFSDTDSNRRKWSKCKPVWNGAKHYHDRHTYSSTFLTVWTKEWADIVKLWIAANDALKDGNLEPLRQFINKEMGQFWEAPTDAPELNTSGDPYSKKQYHEGEKWDDEHARMMKIDVQKVGFWVVIRAWSITDAKSRLLWEGKADTWQTLFDLQDRYGLEHRDVFIDGNYNTDEVVRQIYMHCGDDPASQWNILRGQDSTEGYSFDVGTSKRQRKVKKIYSKYQHGTTSDGKRFRAINFSNLRAKDALAGIMEKPDGSFGVPVDVSKNYVSQMQSETKREVSPGKWRWEKTKSHYHNHLWDCEVMGIVACAIRGILKLETTESMG